MENWLLPITLIPGIGLFILSTTNFSLGLGDEITALLKNADEEHELLEKKIRQHQLLNQALVGLYFSAAIFISSGLLGGISYSIGVGFPKLKLVLLILGTLSFLFASMLLIRFSFRAVRIKRNQFLSKLNRL